MSTSRGFLKDAKGSRTSSKFYGQAPLSGRNMNDNYYPDHQRTSYNSREFQAGIFTNELNRKADLGRKKDQPKQLPLELTEIVDYSSSKVRSSKKPQYEYSRQSRDESLQNYQHNNYELNGYEGKAIKEQLREQMKTMWSQLEFNVMDKVKRMMNEQSARVKETIGDLINQTNNGFKKKQQILFMVKTQTYDLKEQLNKFYKTYQAFSQESEEKFENIYVEMGNLGLKKSKTNGQYNMDLKNSFQGLNSSISVNIGNESHSSKLVNEVIFQLDSQKKQLNQTRVLIDELSQRLNSKLLEIKPQAKPKEEASTDALSLSKEQVSRMIRDAFWQQKKRSKLQERMEGFDIKMKQIQLVVFNQEQNIIGMNNQFTNTVNNQLSPKIKKIQSSLVDIYTRIDSNELAKNIKGLIAAELTQKFNDTRILKIRSCNKPEAQKLSLLTGMNQDKISYKETYLLDEENYLLDSEGNYLVQQLDNSRKRIKIDNDLIYLLQLKGIEITNAS